MKSQQGVPSWKGNAKAGSGFSLEGRAFGGRRGGRDTEVMAIAMAMLQSTVPPQGESDNGPSEAVDRAVT